MPTFTGRTVGGKRLPPYAVSVIPAWIAGIQAPGMVWLRCVHAIWIPAIPAGMTVCQTTPKHLHHQTPRLFFSQQPQNNSRAKDVPKRRGFNLVVITKFFQMSHPLELVKAFTPPRLFLGTRPSWPPFLNALLDDEGRQALFSLTQFCLPVIL